MKRDMKSNWFKKIVKESCEKIAFKYVMEKQDNGKRGKIDFLYMPLNGWIFAARNKFMPERSAGNICHMVSYKPNAS